MSGYAVNQAVLQALNLRLAMTAVGQLQSFSLADRIKYAVKKVQDRRIHSVKLN